MESDAEDGREHKKNAWHHHAIARLLETQHSCDVKKSSHQLPLAPIASAATLTLSLFLAHPMLNEKAEAQAPDSVSVMDLIDSLKMTGEQKAGFQELEKRRLEFEESLETLSVEERQAAQQAFHLERKTAFQKLFSEEQWKRWDSYWTAHWNERADLETPISTDSLDEGLAEATGRFRIAKKNDRITLVTPAGAPFFSLGVTHIQAIAFPTSGEPNLFADRFRRDWSALAPKVKENLEAWGYNSTGYGTPVPLGELMPYAEGILTAPTSMNFGSKQFSYPDVFDPNWQRKVKQTLRFKINAHKDNPNLMGIYWTDMPLWDLHYGKHSGKPNWVEVMKALPEEAPGRQRYEAFVKERGKQATDEALLRLIAQTYYEVLGRETRRLAPDSIIFGERYGPNITPSFVIEEAAPWIDAVAVQPYGNQFQTAHFDRIHRASGEKGILICDHNISFPTEEHPKTMWTQLPTIEEVARAYTQYLEEAFSKPYILGYHRCQYIDRNQPHLGVLKQGLVKADGTPYDQLVNLLAETNRALLKQFADSQ